MKPWPHAPQTVCIGLLSVSTHFAAWIYICIYAGSTRSPTPSPTTRLPTLAPTGRMERSKPNFEPSSAPTALSERFLKAGFGILNKAKHSTLLRAGPSDFMWLSNISQCVGILESAQQDARKLAQASKDKADTPEEMCGGQIQQLSEQECGQQSYADYELDWAILSYEVELAPFRKGSCRAEIPIARSAGCL